MNISWVLADSATADPTLDIAELKRIGVFVKDGTKVKVNPVIILDFEKDIVLQITVSHG
jgi:hypothetical protein